MGGSKKIKWCCHDASTRISHRDKGVSLHCFRCGTTDWEPHGVRSVAEILAARAANEGLRTARSIPDRAVPIRDGAREGIVWLLRGGVTPEQADDLGFRYDPLTRRVLIPITGGFIGRSVFNERPKYIMSAPGTVLYWTGEGRTVAVVEDILSALAVERAGYAAVAILGTSLDGAQAGDIATRSDLLIGWFDGDAAGDKAWALLRKKMALHPTKLTRIRTDKDPKALPRAEVARLIKEAIHD